MIMSKGFGAKEAKVTQNNVEYGFEPSLNRDLNPRNAT
jgi:hypothetical protein